MRDIVVIKERGETIDYLRFPNLHTMQSFFLSRYGCIVEFDAEKRNELIIKQALSTYAEDMIELYKSFINYGYRR